MSSLLLLKENDFIDQLLRVRSRDRARNGTGPVGGPVRGTYLQAHNVLICLSIGRYTEKALFPIKLGFVWRRNHEKMSGPF